MVEVGKVNKLAFSRMSDFGLLLDGEQLGEILIPNRYVSDNWKEGDEIEVFVYLDSEDRLTATTERPKAARKFGTATPSSPLWKAPELSSRHSSPSPGVGRWSLESKELILTLRRFVFVVTPMSFPYLPTAGRMIRSVANASMMRSGVAARLTC